MCPVFQTAEIETRVLVVFAVICIVVAITVLVVVAVVACYSLPTVTQSLKIRYVYYFNLVTFENTVLLIVF